MHFSTWLYLVNDVTGIPMPGQGPLSHNQGNRSLTSSTQWQGALPGCPLWQGKPHVEGMWFREGVACSSPLSCPSSQHAWIKVWYGFWVGTSCCVFFFCKRFLLKIYTRFKGSGMHFGRYQAHFFSFVQAQSRISDWQLNASGWKSLVVRMLVGVSSLTNSRKRWW